MSQLPTLLVVDDKIDNLKLLSDALTQHYRVQAVTSGEEVLLLLDEIAPPDLFLLDIMMPNMDGYELCQHIKARPGTEQTPIIFLTAKNDADSEVRGFEVGAADYVTKPIHPPTLLARVKTHLAIAKHTKTLKEEHDRISALAQQLRILAKAVEEAPNSIVVTNRQGEIVYVNPYFSQVTGYSAEEAIGQNPRILKSGEQDVAVYESLWQTLSRGQVWRGELVNQNKQGALYWESVAIAPIHDDQGETTHYVAIKEDIGDRKNLERVKEDVERIMRHDLKGPLNAIMSFPDLLLMDDNLLPEQRESIELIRDAGHRMHDMINLSLDLFKMETGKYHYEPQSIHLVPVLQQLIQINATHLKIKQLQVQMTLDGAALTSEAMVFVRADARLLFSLLSNLFINAIEASPPEALIDIALTTGTALHLALRNQGAVPETIRQHFFEKYRTHGKKGGTGLGTYSAKLMADTMGMELRMETSASENYTCLWLSLPLNS